MKIYFAKYRPVKGVMKVGDKFLWRGDRVPIVLTAKSFYKTEIVYDSPSYPEECIADMRDSQKVQLFLCSKDIQVGDKVLNKYLEEFTYKEEYEEGKVTLIDKDEAEGYFDKINIFKVIGEISPEATWVKEGDEFDENEVSKTVYSRITGNFWYGNTEGLVEQFPEDYIYAYKILNPSCKHFH